MIRADSVRTLAFGALCLLGVATAAQAHRGQARRSVHTPVSSLFSNSAFFSSDNLRFHGGSERVALQSGGWIHTGHGRFATRFRDAGEAVAASSGHSGGIQCVAFARSDSGIELDGNANTWWQHAVGVYERGSRPEPGSVLNFRANGSMRMGHVAVVNAIVDSRTVMVDHANWGGPGTRRGSVSLAIPVVDVSPANDWTAVRVGLGHSGDYGSIYPTFGFIYNRPDRGVMVAAAASKAAVPAMNPAPRDLRGSARDSVVEVAEAAPEGEGHSYAYGHSGHYGRHHFVVYRERATNHERFGAHQHFGHAVRLGAAPAVSGHAHHRRT